jgi:hypothetical protein
VNVQCLQRIRSLLRKSNQVTVRVEEGTYIAGLFKPLGASATINSAGRK